MTFPVFQIDAFTDEVFQGNPACVVILQNWLSNEVMLKIARENAVAETAFLIPFEGEYLLRWFTPDIEMDLCGHATLAAAHAILNHIEPQRRRVAFQTCSGRLKVDQTAQGYLMQLPSRPPVEAELPLAISEAFSHAPVKVLKARDYMLVFDSEQVIQELQVERQIFDQVNLDPGGVIATAPGNNCDFVSRYFTPQATHLEDPVTGSAHCTLAPYWSNRLDKIELSARQLSERSGSLTCTLDGDYVNIEGQATTYLQGDIYCAT